MEILNLRKTTNGYLINGLTETVLGDINYQDALDWDNDGKEVMSQYTQVELDDIETRRIMIEAKIAKEKALDELQITHETVAYDADGRSIGTMGAVVALVGYRFNQAISIGLPLDPTTPTVLTVLTPTQAYQLLYKDTRINWKGADNVKHNVMLESVCETLEKSIREVSIIIIGVPQ